MCLIVFAYRVHPDYPLILAGNRDEYYERPSSAAHFWPDRPNLLAGQDLRHGGSWLGITRSGRIATVTNVRDPKAPQGPNSRGELVTRLLEEAETTASATHSQPATQSKTAVQRLTTLQQTAAFQQLAICGSQFSGFNLLAGDIDHLYYFTNRPDPTRSPTPQRLAPGLYGLSNFALDTPWPKVNKAKQGLRELLKRDQTECGNLVKLLSDATPAPDAELPDTGIGLNLERQLSSLFIRGDNYGTRASTVLRLHRSGWLEFVEQGFGPQGRENGRREFRLQLSATPQEPA